MASPDPSRTSPKAKAESSRGSYHLTSPEIQSLRESQKKIHDQLKGRFLHLKPKAKAKRG